MTTDLLGAGGFTMLELMIVAVVLGIIAMVLVPGIASSMDDASVSAAAAGVVSALEYARIRAFGDGASMRVTVDARSGTVRVDQYGPAVDLLAPVESLAAAEVEAGVFVPASHPLDRARDFVLAIPGQGAEGVAIGAADFDGTNAVTFVSPGVPSSGGRVELVRGKVRRIVTLEAVTGLVRTEVGR